MSMYVREQRHFCGDQLLEVDLYRVSQTEHRASARAKKLAATSVVQANCNERYSRRYLGQLVATNFSDGAYLLTVTYNAAELPQSDAEADRDITNFTRRIAYKCAKCGMGPPKWIIVTEHQDADAETHAKAVRYHHHMILECGLTRDEVEDCWSRGTGKNRRRLGLCNADRACFDHGRLDGFCDYITKYPKRRRRWRQSRGLKKPITPRPADGKYSRAELDRAATTYIDDAAYWERRYGVQKTGGGRTRQYAFAGCEAVFSADAAEWHVIARFWADPRRQAQKKGGR